MNSLDPIDRSILHALNHDARATSAQIARAVGLPERTVHNRIRRLIEGNYIRAVGVINPKAFGYTLAVDISCEVDLGQTNPALQALMEMPEIAYIALSTGDQDIHLQAFFKNLEEMQHFITTRLPEVPGLRRMHTVLVPSILKDKHDWLPPVEGG